MNKRKYVFALCLGECDTLEKMPDEAFSSGMLGIGYSVEPNEGKFYAPIDGKIENIASAKHALSIVGDDGVEILIHIGVDTVTLNAKGFDVRVKSGELVKRGDLIVTADLDKIRESGLPTRTAVVITNPEIVKGVEYDLSTIEDLSQAVISYSL